MSCSDYDYYGYFGLKATITCGENITDLILILVIADATWETLLWIIINIAETSSLILYPQVPLRFHKVVMIISLPLVWKYYNKWVEQHALGFCGEDVYRFKKKYIDLWTGCSLICVGIDQRRSVGDEALNNCYIFI